MARRATLIEEERAKASSGEYGILVLGGPFEIQPKTSKTSHPEEKTRALAKVYDLMNLDIGYLTPLESETLAQLGAKAPARWVMVDKVRTQIFNTSKGDEIGVVFFPPLSKGQLKPSEDVLGAVDKAVKDLKPKTKTVLGVSPWGYFGETEYYAKTSTPVDVLLGAGPGPAFTGRVQKDGASFWTRAFPKGKALTRLDIIEFPGSAPAKWAMMKNISARPESLKQEYVPNARIEELLVDIHDED